ncbi:MAG: ECF-type sigma factor [Myxococcota bacterium]
MEPEPDEVTPDVYDRLRRLAGHIHHQLARGNQTIQPTVLLHEAWMKLVDSGTGVTSRAHFMAVAGRAMRQILVDHARARHAEKRGGQLVHTSLTGVGDHPRSIIDVLALDAALDRLETLDADAGHVVLLRTFGGMTVAEVAEVLGVSTRRIERTWRFALSYLADVLEP